MKSVLVLCGGRSTEHAIALRSARTVINELDRAHYRVFVCYISERGVFVPIGEMDHVAQSEDLRREEKESRLASIRTFCDFLATIPGVDPQTPVAERLIVFPMIHGQTGEDGEIQGFLQTLSLNYIGNRLTASALCMDKGFANDVFAANGLPQARYITYTRDQWLRSERNADALADHLEATLGLPCFVKPANNGSSVGVNRATRDNLKEAVEDAFRYDRRIVIEEEIHGHEVEVSILGNEMPKASLPGSYDTTHAVLDYNAKYHDTTTVENVPHKLDPETTQNVRDLALRAYRALGCEGFARCDLFVTESGALFMNEINTLPGMTPTSLAPKLWTALTDMTFATYLDTIIDYAEASQEATDSIETIWRTE